MVPAPNHPRTGARTLSDTEAWERTMGQRGQGQ